MDEQVLGDSLEMKSNFGLGSTFRSCENGKHSEAGEIEVAGLETKGSGLLSLVADLISVAATLVKLMFEFGFLAGGTRNEEVPLDDLVLFLLFLVMGLDIGWGISPLDDSEGWVEGMGIESLEGWIVM